MGAGECRVNDPSAGQDRLQIEKLGCDNRLAAQRHPGIDDLEHDAASGRHFESFRRASGEHDDLAAREHGRTERDAAIGDFLDRTAGNGGVARDAAIDLGIAA